VINGSISGQACKSVLNFRDLTGNFDATDRATILTAINTWLTTQVLPSTSSNYFVDSVDAISLETASAGSSTSVHAPPLQGSLGTGVVALNSPGVMTHRTGLRGRNYRGRTYWAGVPKPTNPATGVFNSADISALLSAFAWLTNSANTGGFDWSVLSKFASGTARAIGLLTPIIAVTADLFMDSQRRRLIGRGA